MSCSCISVFTPIATNLDCITDDKIFCKSIVVTGVLSLQGGDNIEVYNNYRPHPSIRNMTSTKYRMALKDKKNTEITIQH